MCGMAKKKKPKELYISMEETEQKQTLVDYKYGI